MNSVLQVLFNTPELDAAFDACGPAIRRTAPEDPAQDLLTQCAKLRDALRTSKYVPASPSAEAAPTAEAAAAAAATTADDGEACVQPRMLKSLLGKGHPEFSSARQ